MASPLAVILGCPPQEIASFWLRQFKSLESGYNRKSEHFGYCLTGKNPFSQKWLVAEDVRGIWLIRQAIGTSTV